MTTIIDAYLGLNAIREAGYRSTATAVAELVDNSIEAGAKNIDIFAVSQYVYLNQRKSNQVVQIAVLDDGKGMDFEVLSSCLSLGWGTRLDTRDGLGRFGFGLKGSSLSQARRADVYSWQKGGQPFRAHLDLDEIKAGRLTDLPEPVAVELPHWINVALGDRKLESGTLVVWSRLDQLDLKKAETLVGRLNKELCRIYRHFLDDDDRYGKKRIIKVHLLQEEERALTKSQSLLANDPLYLLTPNNLDGYINEQTNLPFGEPFTVPIKFEREGVLHESPVEFRFSIAKPEIQNLGGNSVVGRHYANNTGISFVRAGREIDFGSFDFLERSEPRHRWWGAEVRFEPVLDELFGLTNNKQEVRTIKKVDSDLADALVQAEEEGDHKSALLLQIDKILDENISEMMKVIKSRRGGERTANKTLGLKNRVNKDIEKDNTDTESEELAKGKSDAEKLVARIDLLLGGDTSLTDDEAATLALETLDYRVDISTSNWPGSLFLDRRPVANASVGVVNRDSKFYDEFWHYLEEQEDRKGFEALEVLFMAFVRAEDELVREYDKETFNRFRERWGHWVDRLIKHAGS